MAEETFEMIENLESLLRQNKAAEVRYRLAKIPIKKLQSSQALGLANLARRAELPNLALKILGPIVRPETLFAPPPTSEQVSEYAMTLNYIGAHQEAMTLLTGLEPKTYPKVKLYLAFSHFYSWDYERAIPWIEQYLAENELPDYSRLVAEINLAAAYTVCGQFSQAQNLLKKNLVLCKKENYFLLHGNCLELLAQGEILTGNYLEADKFLQKGHALLKDSETIYLFYLEKWQIFSQLLQHGPCQSLVGKVQKLKNLAFKKQSWDSARECDFYLAKARQDLELFHYVFLGTHYPAYRQQLLQRYPIDIIPSSNILWGHRPKLTKSSKKLDLFTGKINGNDLGVKPGQLLHRMLKLFCSDFYRPFRIGEIFGEVFRGEFYNPYTSPDRVHHGVQRLKKMFKTKGLNLDLKTQPGGYKLFPQSGTAICITVGNDARDSNSILLKELQTKMTGGFVSMLEIQSLLSLSASSALRFVNWAIENHCLFRIGQRRGAKYSFKKAA